MNKKIRRKLKLIKERKPIAPPSIRMKSKKDYNRFKHKKLAEKNPEKY